MRALLAIVLGVWGCGGHADLFERLDGDGGTPDASADAGRDDAAIDASSDASTDASSDASTDSSSDVTALDSTVDASALSTYVSPAGSDATGDGTRENPVRTIGRGIQNAVSIGPPVTVVVAGGAYAETITMVEGVSIMGGFECASLPCSWNHDPGAQTSAIDGGATDNGVDIDGTITRATTLSHVSVTSGRTAISVRGGAPILRDVVITGRTGVSAFGIGTDPLIERATVVGTLRGISIEGAGEVRESDVEGSPAISVRGVVIVSHNLVHAAGESGITAYEGDPQILANVINEDDSRVGTCSFGFLLRHRRVGRQSLHRQQTSSTAWVAANRPRSRSCTASWSSSAPSSTAIRSTRRASPATRRVAAPG